jgi:uncharacterized sodium:solute symporter family permease YidK
MKSKITLPAIIGILAVGLFFANIPLADAMQDITLKKIKLDKNWSKLKIEIEIIDFTNTQLSDLTVKLLVLNELNFKEHAFSFVNAKSLEVIDSKNMEITKIKLDKNGKMKIESKISGLTKTSPSKILVGIQIIHSNGETAAAQSYVK